MTEKDLHIADRLRDLLPRPTDEERNGLRNRIVTDGVIRDRILWWFDGERNVIVDGMTRWDIHLETGVSYDTQQMFFDSYEEAELWMLENQLCRRNLLNPAAIRKIRGELYNRLKTTQGGDRKSQESKGQNVHLIEDVAEKSGVTPKTLQRDGARLDAVKKLTEPAQRIADKATDAEIKAIGKLDAASQTQVARLVRVDGKTFKEALKGFKPPASSKAKDYGKCPNCLGTKWDEDEKGITCHKCHHAHGEPAGDVDDKQLTIQRSKTVKTVEALMRAFDDLYDMLPKPERDAAIEGCKSLLKLAKAWK